MLPPTIAFARRLAATTLSALLISAPLLAPLPAQAWGFEGHRMIAGLAEQQLTPAAHAEVQRLLALEPGATMSSVATWADEIRSPVSGRWHYVNFPKGDCNYEPPRDCPDGACVIEALKTQTALLGSKAGDAERLVALKFVIHLVGDVHQPLHAGYGEDKGGNTVQMQAFGRGTNLHSLWDTGLLMNHEGGVPALRAELAPQLQGVAKPEAVDAAAWALESCHIVESKDFYPDSRQVGVEYRDAHEAVLEERLKLAAHRLAAVLNNTLR